MSVLACLVCGSYNDDHNGHPGHCRKTMAGWKQAAEERAQSLPECAKGGCIEPAKYRLSIVVEGTVDFDVRATASTCVIHRHELVDVMVDALGVEPVFPLWVMETL